MGKLKQCRRVLIIGGGLSGTTLSYFLSLNGIDSTILNTSSIGAASKVAAGLIKPITGKRITLSWNASEFIEFSKDFFQSLENKSGINLYSEMNFLQLFKTIGERNEWLSRSSIDSLKPFISDIAIGIEKNSDIKAPFGGIYLKHCAIVDPTAYFEAIYSVVAASATIIDEKFEADKLVLDNNGVRYESEQLFDRIIFCDGYRGYLNGYFSKIPFKPVKGELISIECDDLPDELIIGSGTHLIPKGKGQFLFGATYDWDDMTPYPTTNARNQLIKKLKNIIAHDFIITGHFAGIRPSVQDRRPVVGFLDEFPQVGIFNGMGSKGYLMAPMLAKHFSQHILEGTPLFEEISLSRF